MNIQAQIDAIKIQLDEAETAYCHAFAAGDLAACSQHKRVVVRHRNAIGRLVKQKLALR